MANNKAAIGIGLVTATVLGIILLAKRTQAGPGPGPGPIEAWAYSEEQSTIMASGVGNWNQVIFQARVTNPWSNTTTKTLRLMVRHEYDGVPTEWMTRHFINLTLSPGGSYLYQSPADLLLIAIGDIIESKLVDSDGTESAVSRAENI